MSEKGKNEIIAFDNDFNKLTIGELNSKELNILMTIFMFAKDRGTDEIRLPLSMLHNVANVKNVNNDIFCENLRTFKRRVNEMEHIDTVTGVYEGITLFDFFHASKADNEVVLHISSPATYLLNHLEKNFTLMDLGIHNRLSLKASKILYRNLCQYKNTGYWEIDVKTFRDIFGVTKSLATRKIKNQIIEPAINELEDLIDISCDVIKEGSSHATTGYVFKFEFKGRASVPGSAYKSLEKYTPDTRTENDKKIIGEYKSVIYEKIKGRVELGDYQTTLIATKAHESGCSVSELGEYLKTALEMKNISNFMGLIQSIIKEPDRYMRKNIECNRESQNNNKFCDFKQREYDFTELEKIVF